MTIPEAFTRVRRHRGKVSVFALVLAAVIFYLEPLQPRFEGLTVRQWIERNADRREFPRREVVEYFGESAVPVLVRELQPNTNVRAGDGEIVAEWIAAGGF